MVLEGGEFLKSCHQNVPIAGGEAACQQKKKLSHGVDASLQLLGAW